MPFLRSSERVLSVALALSTCALLATAFSTQADARSEAHRVYVAWQACEGRSYRPKEIILACGDGSLFATDIHYSFYGEKKAVASVELHTHNCLPNCAQSPFHAFPGTLTLDDVVRCGGVLYYSQARYRFTHGAPYGESSASPIDIEPLSKKCSPVPG
jgi:hypothetical protein